MEKKDDDPDSQSSGFPQSRLFKHALIRGKTQKSESEGIINFLIFNESKSSHFHQ